MLWSAEGARFGVRATAAALDLLLSLVGGSSATAEVLVSVNVGVLSGQMRYMM